MKPKYANTGYGPNFFVLDIGLSDKVAVIEPDTAFWAVVEKNNIEKALSGEAVLEFEKREVEFKKEMDYLRFGLVPSAVYFNPTERCNFNCTYCYLPEDMRREGKIMTKEEISTSLLHLRDFFYEDIGIKGTKPQIIFHGSEPLLAKDAIFSAIEEYRDDFLFGIQTNGTLLEDKDIDFIREHNVGIGVSLDAPRKEVSDKIRKNWAGEGAFSKIVDVIDKLSSYPGFNVISTVTKINVAYLPEMIDFCDEHNVHMIMLNPVRCTQKGGQQLKPDDEELSHYFLKALDRIYEIYREKGKKIIVTNFTNIMAAICGPTTRRLMCDISPCGGGRCFFAMSAHGNIFPCSEFIGFPEFSGGNIFKNKISDALSSIPFKKVTGRKVENIDPCRRCAIRHFCGAPCPAEVYSFYGEINSPSPYCSFYEELIRYAFRLIAAGKHELYLWDDWEDETVETFRLAS